MVGCNSSKIDKDFTNKVHYYSDVIEKGNTGVLKLIYPIKNIEYSKKLTYVKAYYRQGYLYKIEKYKKNIKIPRKIFFINKDNINYRVKYNYKNKDITCDLTYVRNMVTTKNIICSDGTSQIIKMTKLHLISDIKYNKIGVPIKKSIFINGDIETFEYIKGKMVKIKDEVR